MATVNKNFKIKSGLVVEGTTGTIDGEDILTKKQADIDYIINEVGGSGVSENTPDTLVLRDGSGNFAAGTVTVSQVNIGTIGYIQDDGDVVIANTDNQDVVLQGEDIRLNAQDDVRLNAIGGDVVLTSSTGNIRLDGPNIYAGENLNYVDAERVATQGYVDDAINNIDLTFNSDEITEGTTNLYYTDARVDSHLSGGDGITYSAGTISADVAGGLHISNEQIQINRDTVDTWYDASGAASSAQTAAESYADGLASNYDAAGSASTAEQNANEYTDGEITTALTTAQGYADTAEANANAYTDNAVSGLAWKTAVNLLWDDPSANGNGNTGTLVIDGHSALTQADDGYRILTTANGQYAGIYTYTDNGTTFSPVRSEDADAFGELIGAAVYVMEGTQYGSTSWVQSNHYLSDFTGQSWTQFSGQGSVTAGSGITVDGLEVSVDRTAVDTWYDAAGSADTVQGNLEDHASDTSTHGVTEIVGTSESQTLTNKTIDAASNTLSNIANSSLTNSSITVNGYSTDLGSSVTLDTDDVSEGTAKYFTDTRAKESAANLLTGASLTNITITGDENGLTITAENGVDDSTTDDLEEGTTNLYYTDARAKAEAAALLTNATKTNITITADGSNNLTITAEGGVGDATTDDLVEGEDNLYFTDSRAVDAIVNSDIRPTTVEIDDYRKEEATRTSVGSTSTANLHSFEYPWESAKYLVRVVGWVGGVKHSQLTEILITKDGSNNIAISEYGTICTDSNNLASFTATEASGVITLTGTTATVTSCEIITAATLLSWAD